MNQLIEKNISKIILLYDRSRSDFLSDSDIINAPIGAFFL